MHARQSGWLSLHQQQNVQRRARCPPAPPESDEPEHPTTREQQYVQRRLRCPASRGPESEKPREPTARGSPPRSCPCWPHHLEHHKKSSSGAAEALRVRGRGSDRSLVG